MNKYVLNEINFELTAKKAAILIAAALLLFILAFNLVLATPAVNAAPNEKNLNGETAASSFEITLDSAAKLTVRATDIRKAKGKVVFSIYDSGKSWKESENGGKAMREVSADVVAGKTAKDNTATAVFDDLPPGTYAVLLHHDENGNGKMDTTLGVPKEGYGMSNDPKIGMSMPKFETCKFDVAEGEQTVSIKMKY